MKFVPSRVEEVTHVACERLAEIKYYSQVRMTVYSSCSERISVRFPLLQVKQEIKQKYLTVSSHVFSQQSCIWASRWLRKLLTCLLKENCGRRRRNVLLRWRQSKFSSKVYNREYCYIV